MNPNPKFRKVGPGEFALVAQMIERVAAGDDPKKVLADAVGS